MGESEPHTFPDVLVVSGTEQGWLCKIEGRFLFIGRGQVEPGTDVPATGQRGPLTVQAYCVETLRAAIRRGAR